MGSGAGIGSGQGLGMTIVSAVKTTSCCFVKNMCHCVSSIAGGEGKIVFVVEGAPGDSQADQVIAT